MVTAILRIQKKEYYTKFFTDHKSDVKATWKGIRSLINVSKKNNLNLHKLIENKQEISEPSKIASTLNKFYISIGQKIESKIPNIGQPYQDYLGEMSGTSLTLNECTFDEISQYISKLDVSKSSGPFSIPTKILKMFSKYFVYPLTTIINKSMREGIFPTLLKFANVCPIFKKGEKTKCSNYRPISLLSNVSKLFEWALYKRIEDFLNINNTIYDLQFGFRKKYSTTHALLSMTEVIRKQLNGGSYSCGVFVDLQKAFDTVNHDILLSKLDHYGIRQNANLWIKSYLCNRKQSVKVNGCISECEEITCGVPQGSILGPLLFIIYINDMHRAVKQSIVHHFADDTNLIFSGKSPNEIRITLNKELQHLYEWLCANRLSLNAQKTEFIIFRPARKKLPFRITLKIQNTKLFESTKIKYLGIILDQRLAWSHHINELAKKLNRTLGLVYKIRENCTRDVLRSLYFSLFHSHLTYGIPVWGKCAKFLLERIRLIHKKVLRAISFSDFRAPTTPILKNLEILDIDDLIKQQIASLMWEYDHNIMPPALSKLFTARNTIHAHNLRNARNDELYTAQRYKNAYGLNSFCHNGALIFNEIKNYPFYNTCISKATFNKKMKDHILENY